MTIRVIGNTVLSAEGLRIRNHTHLLAMGKAWHIVQTFTIMRIGKSAIVAIKANLLLSFTVVMKIGKNPTL